MKQNSVSRKKLQNTNQSKGITNKTKEKKTKHKSNNSTMINKTINKTIKSNTNINYTLSEVIDDTTYTHFKSLIKKSPDLCKGQTGDGKCYKIRKSLLKDMKALKKDNHYRILYIHNNKEIIAYISTKLYSKDGGFMFIHKLCSKAGTGLGKKLIKLILDDAKKNYEKLKITYLSLTTQNLDIVNYYKQFKPTRIVEVDTPGSKAKIPERCAYMIWQLSPNMPHLNYN